MKNKILSIFVFGGALFSFLLFSGSVNAYYTPGQTLNPSCGPLDSGCDITPPTGSGAYYASDQGLSLSSGGVFSLVLSDNSLQALASGLSLNINGLTGKSTVNNGDYIPLYGTDGNTYKVTKSDLLSGITGSLTYQGAWDASGSATPETCDGTTNNHYWVASANGNGYTTGDWAICNGTAWQKITNSVTVSSVMGRTGAVTASSGDYIALQITNTPAGNIAATNVQNALNELDTEKLSLAGSKLSDIADVSSAGSYASNANKVLAVNGAGNGLAWVAQSSGSGSSALTNGYIFVGNSSGIATAVAMSGDVAIGNTGATTIQNGVVTSTKIADGTITNADINGTAALDWTKISKIGAKLSDLDVPSYTGNGGKILAVNSGVTGLEWVSGLTNSLTSGNIFVGNGSGVATGVTMSGDATISNTGVLTIGADKVALGTDTTGNYVAGATSNLGLILSGTEAATLGILLDGGSLALSSSGIKLNTANANTWAADQTFVNTIFNGTLSGTAIDTDGTLTANSDTKLATQRAVKTYVSNFVDGLAWRSAANIVDSTQTNAGANIVGQASYTADGVALTNGMRLLLTAETTNTATYLNKVFTVSGVGSSIVLTLATDGQAGTGAPSSGDTLYVQSGTSNGNKTYTYNGTSWVLGSSLSGGLLATNNLSDVSNAVNARNNLGLGTANSPTFTGLTISGTGITAPTATNTINGLIINSGVLNGVNGITFLAGSGNFDMSASSGTFKTGTGAITLNGDTALASGKSLTSTGGVSNIDFSSSTGTTKTGTGAVTLNGNTTISAGKTLTLADITAGSILFAGTSGVASQNNSKLFWDNTNNRLGLGTVTPDAGFTNALSTVYTAVAVSDLATGGDVGTAASTVDVSTTFNISQTTADQTITLPTPTSTSSGRIAYVSNTGSTSFAMYGATVAVNKGLTLQWSGSAWVPLNSVPAGSAVTLSSLTAASATNAIDNLNYGQTWNWSTATTQNPMTITANALTTGSGLSLTTSSTGLASTNGLLHIANTGSSSSGILARLQSNSTAGSGLTVLADGNVGIGIDNPTARLNVNGTISTGNGTNGYMTMNTDATDRAGFLEWRLGNGTRLGFMGDSASDITLALENGADFTINGGKVGIGTIAPTNALTFANNSTIDSIGSLNITTAVNGSLSLTSNGTGAITLDSGTTGSINIGTGSYDKQITIGNNTSTTGVGFFSGLDGFTFNTTTSTLDGILLNANSVTNTNGMLVNANALTTGNGLKVSGDMTGIGNLVQITEDVASIGAGYALKVSTLASSNAKPFYLGARGLDVINTAADGTIYFGNTTSASSIIINTTPSGSSGTSILPSVAAGATAYTSGSITGDYDTSSLSIGPSNDSRVGTDGFPVMSYLDSTNGDLKFAKCNDINCSSFTTRTIDNTASHTMGHYSSIAIGTDGFPIIGYIDSTDDDLMMAHCNDASCSTSTTRELDTAASDESTDIQIGTDGFAVIAYHDATNGDLQLYHCSNTACSAGTTVAVDTTSTKTGTMVSMIIGGNGFPFIVYQDVTSSTMKIAYCTDVTCSTPVRTVLNVDPVGSRIGLALTSDNLPIISWANAAGTISVWRCTKEDCSARTSVSVATGMNTASMTDIAIASDGLPMIVGSQSAASGFTLIKCTDIACSNVVTSTIISGNAMSWPSIMKGSDGLPFLTYYDGTDGDASYVKCTNNYCRQGSTNTYTTYGVDIGSVTKFFRNIYGANVFAKTAQVSYFDIAEEYSTNDSTLSAGEIVAVDPTSENYVKRAEAGDSILGVVSTQPGILMSDWGNTDGITKVPLALAGRVPVKLEGSIKAGEYLALSTTTPGVARKALFGEQTVGKALSDSDADTVMAFVQNGINMTVASVGESSDSTSSIAIDELNRLAVSGGLAVVGHVALGVDTVGEATVSNGSTSVTIDFATPYTEKPSITVTPEAQVNGNYWVSGISADGFNINVSSPQNSNVTFSWHAFAQKGKAFTVAPVVEQTVSTGGQTTGGGNNTTCEAPQVLNETGDGCVNPNTTAPVCTGDQILNTAGDTCIDPEPSTPASLTCEGSQVLNEAGDACVDPAPSAPVCTGTQILNADGNACVDPEPKTPPVVAEEAAVIESPAEE